MHNRSSQVKDVCSIDGAIKLYGETGAAHADNAERCGRNRLGHRGVTRGKGAHSTDLVTGWAGSLVRHPATGSKHRGSERQRDGGKMNSGAVPSIPRLQMAKRCRVVSGALPPAAHAALRPCQHPRLWLHESDRLLAEGNGRTHSKGGPAHARFRARFRAGPKPKIGSSYSTRTVLLALSSIDFEVRVQSRTHPCLAGQNPPLSYPA